MRPDKESGTKQNNERRVPRSMSAIVGLLAATTLALTGCSTAGTASERPMASTSAPQTPGTESATPSQTPSSTETKTTESLPGGYSEAEMKQFNNIVSKPYQEFIADPSHIEAFLAVYVIGQDKRQPGDPGYELMQTATQKINGKNIREILSKPLGAESSPEEAIEYNAALQALIYAAAMQAKPGDEQNAAMRAATVAFYLDGSGNLVMDCTLYDQTLQSIQTEGAHIPADTNTPTLEVMSDQTDPSGKRIISVRVISSDGTEITITLVSKKVVTPDGSQFTLYQMAEYAPVYK